MEYVTYLLDVFHYYDCIKNLQMTFGEERRLHKKCRWSHSKRTYNRPFSSAGTWFWCYTGAGSGSKSVQLINQPRTALFFHQQVRESRWYCFCFPRHRQCWAICVASLASASDLLRPFNVDFLCSCISQKLNKDLTSASETAVRLSDRNRGSTWSNHALSISKTFPLPLRSGVQ